MPGQDLNAESDFSPALLELHEAPPHPAARAVLLVFTPLLSFLVTTMLRQLPFSSRPFSVWMRALACLGTLLILTCEYRVLEPNFRFGDDRDSEL